MILETKKKKKKKKYIYIYIYICSAIGVDGHESGHIGGSQNVSFRSIS